MRLIVITPENTIAGEPQLINSLFDAGLQRLHLRKPTWGISAYKDHISATKECYHKNVVLCEHFELLHEFDIGGIHVNSHEREGNEWQQYTGKKPGLTLSTSFHAWEEIRATQTRFDYVFISPVFDSISKKGYKAAIDLTGANALKKYCTEEHRHCPQIIGLGGVNAQNLSILYDQDFDGGAVLGAIWESRDPITAYIELQKVIAELPPRPYHSQG